MKKCMISIVLLFLVMTMTILQNHKVSANSWQKQPWNTNVNNDMSYVLEDHVAETSFFVDPFVVVSLVDYGKIYQTNDGSKPSVQCPAGVGYTTCLQQNKVNPNLPPCGTYSRDRRCNPWELAPSARSNANDLQVGI